MRIRFKRLKSEFGLGKNDKLHRFWLCAHAAKKIINFLSTSQSKDYNERKSHLYYVQLVVQLIHYDIAQLGAMIMSLSEISHSLFLPFNGDGPSSARIKAAAGGQC